MLQASDHETPVSKSEQPSQVGCPIGCPHCDVDGLMDRSAGLGRWQGWRLAAVYALIFLWPLALAVAGALAVPRFWRHPLSQIIGGAGGLLLGAIDAALVFRLVFREKPQAPQ